MHQFIHQQYTTTETMEAPTTTAIEIALTTTMPVFEFCTRLSFRNSHTVLPGNISFELSTNYIYMFEYFE